EMPSHVLLGSWVPSVMMSDACRIWVRRLGHIGLLQRLSREPIFLTSATNSSVLSTPPSMPIVALLRSAESVIVACAACKVSFIDELVFIVDTGTVRMNVWFFPESKVVPITELFGKMIVDDSGSMGSLRSSGVTGHLSIPSSFGIMPSDVAPKSLVVIEGL